MAVTVTSLEMLYDLSTRNASRLIISPFRSQRYAGWPVLSLRLTEHLLSIAAGFDHQVTIHMDYGVTNLRTTQLPNIGILQTGIMNLQVRTHWPSFSISISMIEAS